MSEGLLNIWKLYISNLNTTVHLQIEVIQKQHQRVCHVYTTNPM